MAVAKDKTRIQVTMPIKVKEQLKSMANSNNKSVSNYILNLILDDIKRLERKI